MLAIKPEHSAEGGTNFLSSHVRYSFLVIFVVSGLLHGANIAFFNSMQRTHNVTVFRTQLVVRNASESTRITATASGGTTKLRLEIYANAKELTRDRLAIVQKAGMIDLLDRAQEVRKSHPFMGARDADGNFGFVYDVTRLSRDINRPALQLNQSVCGIHDDNWQELMKRVRINWERLHSNELPSVKVLCAVYSAEPYHWKLDAALETWAPQCDGFFVASNVTDPRYHAVDVPHHQEGEEIYHNMWQKVRSMLCYIYENYFDDFDWFHVGGDDMWLIVENLKLYLASDEIQLAANGGNLTRLVERQNDEMQKQQTPLLLGCRLAQYGDISRIYVAGGPGYTMNKAALKLLVTQGMGMFADLEASYDHVCVSLILTRLGVEPYPTTDGDGSQRYNHFTPGRHYNSARHMPDWFNGSGGPSNATPPSETHSSIHSVSFHMVDNDDMRRFYALMHNMCPLSSYSR